MLILSIVLQLAFSAYQVTYEVHDGNQEILQVQKTQHEIKAPRTLQDFPLFLAEKTKTNSISFYEVLYPDHMTPKAVLNFNRYKKILNSEVRVL